MAKKTPEELALEAYLAGLTGKKILASDNKIVINANMNKNPNWIAGHKRATEKHKEKFENDKEYREKRIQQAIEASKALWENETTRKLMTEKFQERSKKDSWKQAIKKAAEKRAKDPNWIKANKEAMVERSNTKWKDNIIQRNKDMAKDPNWIASHQKSRNRVVVKPVLTPFGPFMSLKEAGNTLNVTPECIGYRIKQNHEGYHFITKEEYIMLTGKDPFNE